MKAVVREPRVSLDQFVSCRDVLVDLDRVDSLRCCGACMHIILKECLLCNSTAAEVCLPCVVLCWWF